MAVPGADLGNQRLIRFGRCRAEGQTDVAKAQLEQPIATPRLTVVVALGRGSREDLDLPVIEAEATIDSRDLRLDSSLVRQQESRRAAFDDSRRDGAAVDVAEALRRKDQRSILLPQRLQPFAELLREGIVIEREPALVDDEQRGSSVEPITDPVEQVREDGGRRAGSHQPLDLEGLHIRRSEPFGLGIKQPAIGSTYAVCAERLLQVIGLQQDREAGHGPLPDRGRGQRGQRGPDMFLHIRGDLNVLARQDGDDPGSRPGAL